MQNYTRQSRCYASLHDALLSKVNISYLTVCGLQLVPAPFLFASDSAAQHGPSRLEEEGENNVCERDR